MRAASIVFTILMCLCLLASEPLNRPLSVSDARSLVNSALSRETKRLPGLALVPDSRWRSEDRCLTFDVLWRNLGPGSAHVDFYTVDVKTGNVWRGVLYERVTNRAVSAVQTALRKRLGITDEEFRRAAQLHVCGQ